MPSAASLTVGRDADHAWTVHGPGPRRTSAAFALVCVLAALACDRPYTDAGGAAARAHEDTVDTVGTVDAGVAPPDDSLSDPAPADTFFEGSEQVWLEAYARGVTFRAVGQEPGWVIEIGENDALRILMDYGAREITLPLPPPVVDSTTWVTTYQERTAEHSVRVDIRDQPCADVMSGERFAATVVLIVDGVRYNGCGRTLHYP